MSIGPGRGWHGDSAGHAAAGTIGGQKSGGNFAKDRTKASRAGSASGGNFARDKARAIAAGRAGGKKSAEKRQLIAQGKETNHPIVI